MAANMSMFTEMGTSVATHAPDTFNQTGGNVSIIQEDTNQGGGGGGGGGGALYLTDYNEYVMAIEMYPYHTWIFVIAGLIGNLLALIVICQKNMRGNSSSVFVMVLSVADNVALLGFLLGMVSLIYSPHIIMDEFCMLYFFILSCGSMISAWTVAAMSFERVLIVTFPLKGPTWTSRTKAVIMEAIIIFFIVMHNIHFFWTAMESPYQNACEYNYMKYGTFLGKWSIYDACMSSYIPLCLIIVMNVIIIVMMTKARNIQKSMSNNTQNGAGEKKKSSLTNNATNQITIMLLSVSVAFFICMTPYAIFQIYINEILDFSTITLAKYASVSLANQWCLILWEMNHSINVVLYSLTGRKFRMNMLKLFTCGKYGDKPRSATYATDSRVTTNMARANGAQSKTSVTTVSEAV